MSASATDLVEFVRHYEAATMTHNPEVHPAALATIAHWFGAMRNAAHEGNAASVARLCDLVEDKLALERSWCCNG